MHVSSYATKTQYLVAAGLLTALLATFGARIPLSATVAPGSEALLPVYAAAATVLETVTAALLLSLYSLQRSTALLVLACGYIVNVLMMPAWALTFPAAFATFGMDFGPQTAAVIDTARRLAFPVFALGYALAPTGRGATLRAAAPIVRNMILAAAGAGLVLGLVFAVAPAEQAAAPDVAGSGAAWRVVPWLALGLYGLGAGVLLWRRRNLLDVWMSIVLLAFSLELVFFLSPGGEVHVTVADTGTGISPDRVDSIFEPFMSTKTGGMGMGLMFCRSVVEAHRGRLWVTANAPRGAVFHIALPIEAPLTLGAVPIRVEPAPAPAHAWSDAAGQLAG